MITHDNRFFTLDTLSGLSWGIIASKPDTGLDCRMMDAVTGFNITASQPDGTEIYLAFSADGSDWFRLAANGTPISISSGIPDFDTLRISGNNIASLRALTNIPAFARKLVRVTAGLSSNNPANVKPSLNLSVKGSTASQTTSFTEYSPVYDLGSNAVISDIPFETVLSGGASVSVSAKITNEEGESEWLSVPRVIGKSAKSIQLKADYYSPQPGVSSAKLSSLYVQYTKNAAGAPLSGGRIYSVTEDWHMNIKSARITVRHSPLEQSGMKVYAAFRKSPGHVINHQLGISPSAKKTYDLPKKGGIRYDSFRLFSDNQELSSGFELNSEAGRVTLTAPEGSVITCSYDYGWDLENWKELTLDNRVSLDDYDISEYKISISDNNYSAASFMIESNCTSGHEYNELLGRADGNMQTYQLKHRAVNIPSVTYNNIILARKNFTLLEDSRLVRVAAPAGSYIRASYEWQSEPVQIHQVCAVYYD